MYRHLALAMATVGASACTIDEPDEVRACTDAGCSDVVSIEVLRVDDPALIADATLELCVNERCSRFELPGLRASFAGLSTRLDGKLASRMDLARVASGAEVTVTVEQADGLEDGDAYTIELRASDGGLLVGKSWTATYTASYPNGPECEPGCMHATLTAVP